MDYQTPLSIQMSSPDLTEAERQAVLDVVSTSHLSIGPQVKAFENSFKRFSGVRHAIAVNSGTSGLHLCIRAAGIKPGDLVLTTPFSFVASTNAILFEKGIPVFVDVDPVTGNIDTRLVEEAVSDLASKTGKGKRWLPRIGAGRDNTLKALLAVDVFGQPADYDPLLRLSRSHNLRLINDSCESLGAEYKHRKTGTLGDYGVFAFYPNKQITTGEGGMIVTDDDEAATLMEALRNQGRSPNDTWLQHTHLGYNYRLDEMSSALGVVQMQRLPELLAKRKQAADWYNERLSHIAGVELPHVVDNTTAVSWFVYVIRINPDVERSRVANHLAKSGIPVRPYFTPIHLQPYMVEQFGYKPGDFPVTEDLGRRGLALPFSSKTTLEQVERVCQGLRECL
jgi:dTDP-4-amino-4,6-dideoxygalactose transaminase